MDTPPYEIVSKSLLTLTHEGKDLHELQQAVLSHVDANCTTGPSQLVYMDGNQPIPYQIYIYNHFMDQNQPSQLTTVVSDGSLPDGNSVDALVIIGNSVKEISNLIDQLEFGPAWDPNGQPIYGEESDTGRFGANPGLTRVSISHNYYLP